MSEHSEDAPPRRRLAPTLADVARLAGVSTSTAGRVIRNQGWPVEPSSREKVLAAAAELSYVPNLTARTLRGGAPAFVGLIIGNMLDPYYGEIGEIVTRHSIASNKMLAMVCNMQRDPKLELEYCRRLWEHRVAGLVLAGGGFDQFTHYDELSALLAQMERNGVIVTTLSPRDLDLPCFSVDNRAVGRMAVAELVARGHSEIAVLTAPIQNRVLHERVAGMKEVMEKAGIRPLLVESPARSQNIRETIASLYERQGSITAFIAASSLMSIKIIEAIEATGRRVPDDASVVGIGGKALGEGDNNRLAHVDLCLDRCARAALDYIRDRIDGASAPGGLVCAPRLDIGSSLAPAAPR